MTVKKVPAKNILLTKKIFAKFMQSVTYCIVFCSTLVLLKVSCGLLADRNIFNCIDKRHSDK